MQKKYLFFYKINLALEAESCYYESTTQQYKRVDNLWINTSKIILVFL